MKPQSKSTKEVNIKIPKDCYEFKIHFYGKAKGKPYGVTNSVLCMIKPNKYYITLIDKTVKAKNSKIFKCRGVN